MLLLLILSAAAALIGALAMRGAVSDLRLAGSQKSARAGFYCAEAGLAAARGYFAVNQPVWNAMFDPAQSPPPGYPVTGDLDGDGLIDYQVTLIDNVDEFPPAAGNRLRDNDLTAIMVSRCIGPGMGAHQLQQIVTANTRGTGYRAQAGHGSNHTGNLN